MLHWLRAKAESRFQPIALGAALIFWEVAMYTAIIFAFTLLSMHAYVTDASAEATSAGAPAQEPAPSGSVTGINGRVVASAVGSNQTRELRPGDAVMPGDELRVGAGSMIEVLWNKRALFSLREQTVVRLLEATGGQTPVQVIEGHARIAYSYNEGHPTDTLAVMTPEARTVMRGGILEAIAGSETPRGDRHLMKFERKQEDAREAGRGDIIRIVEGQAKVEPASSSMKPVLLKAGHEVRVSSAGTDAPRRYMPDYRYRLAGIASHQEIPQSAVQRLAGIHVDHALELEEGLRKGAEDVKNVKNTDTGGVKGAILSTSLGIPVTPLQASSGSLTSGSSPVSPTVAIAPTTGAGSGPVSIPAPVAAPVPVPAPIQVPVPIPSASTFVPSQSGGINSASLLQQILKDALDNPGKGKSKGRDRD
jgi:hypothetical protein